MENQQSSEFADDGETYRKSFASSNAWISFGLRFPQACVKHVNKTFKASRIYIIASGSLSRDTNHARHLQDALGEKVVGIRNGMTPHTLWSEVLEIVRDAREANADLLVTLGAGSLTDAAKIIALVSRTLFMCSSVYFLTGFRQWPTKFKWL